MPKLNLSMFVANLPTLQCCVDFVSGVLHPMYIRSNLKGHIHTTATSFVSSNHVYCNGSPTRSLGVQGMFIIELMINLAA